jgi:Cu(I)/Ag(I) efflux system membrane fusion protein
MSTTPETPWSFWKKVIFFLKFLEIRLRFIFILVVTAMIVGYWDYFENYWERWTRGKVETEQAQSEWEFYCGMHPYVIRDKPGLCPVCGMNLDRRKRGERQKLPPGVLARVQVLPERVMQAGVEVETVSYRMLSRTARSYGLVEVDESRLARISLRFPGRVDELMVNTVGVAVKKGEPLAKVYSPKYLAASHEYVQALEAQRKAEADPRASVETKQLAATIAQSTRQRLALAQFTPEQLAALERGEKPGDHVTFHSPIAGVVIEKNVLLGDTLEEGTTLYTVADLSVLWVQMLVAEADISAVNVGMPVEVTAVAWPGAIFYGNVDLIYPTLSTESRSLKARVAVGNKDGRLKPGMFVTATARAPAGRYGEVGTPREPKVDPAEQVEAAKGDYPLDYCLVTGQKLGSMGDPVELKHEGRTFKFCCDGCPPKFKADPAKYIKLLDEAVAKAMPGGAASRWTEGWACGMHPDQLRADGGVCRICGCGMQTVKWRVERLSAIPETAVVDTGTRYVVYLEKTPGVFESRAVTLGPRCGAYYPVLAGLALNDRVVTRGSFLIDAEARFNPPPAETEEAPPAKQDTPAPVPSPHAGHGQ